MFLLSISTILTILSIPIACEETTPNVANPSGDCETTEDGSRSCYHAPMNTDVYLPDCNNTLEREYWRVFAMDQNSAYIIPRPDGMGLFYDLCDDSEIGILMDTYKLCRETLRATDIDLINNIPPDDALLIANALHENLFFTVDDNGGLNPWAPPNDIVDVCNMSSDNDSVIESFCETALEYYDNDSGEDCPNVVFLLSSEEAQVLAGRLNTLYGLDLGTE
jgi:hypothetical protein